MESKPAGKIVVGHPVDVASGTLFHEFDDFTLPGRVPLIFKRRYSTALIAKSDGMFGQGWSSPCEMSLIRDIDGCRLIGEDGDTEIVFDDNEGVLESGGVLYNFGAFHELRLQGEKFVVTRWTPDGDDIVRFEFKANGALPCSLVSRTNVEGQGINFHRDGQGRVVSLRQVREGRALKLIYSATNRVTEVQVVAPNRERRVLRYSYDQNDRLSEMTDPLGNRCHYEYDNDGRMMREITLGRLEFGFRYDPQGRCVATSAQDKFDLHTLEFFDAARLTQVKNSLGHITSYYWNASGQIEKEISPLGDTQSTVYDDFGRIVQEISAIGAATSYEFDERGNQAKVISPIGAVTQYEYNENHQITAAIDPIGHRWEYDFDRLGNFIAARDPLGGTWSYTFSEHQDLLAITDPLGFRRTFTWNTHGHLTSATDWLGQRNLYECDDYGRITAMIDPLGHRTEAAIDPLGRIAQITHPDGTSRKFAWNVFDQIIEFHDELGAVTRWEYTASGLVYRITRPHGGQVRFQYGTIPAQLMAVINENGERHSYEYDAAGRMIKETDFGGKVTRYEYDKDGQIVASENAAGHRTELRRDAVGAVRHMKCDDGSTISYEYDAKGYLIKADNRVCSVEREYDAAGRLITEKQGEHIISNEYDAAGYRLRRQSSLGRETFFAWDGNGQIARIQTKHLNPIYFEYDASQFEVARYVPDGVRINQASDARSRCVEQWTGSSRRLRNFSVGINALSGIHRQYQYDAASDLTEMLDARWGATKYTYDPAGRIASARHQDSFTERFVYDRADNITRIDRLPGSAVNLDFPSDSETQNWQYARGNELVRCDGVTYQYDALGQVVRKADDKGETTYEWNRFGQLAKVTLPNGREWQYSYDAFGRRVEKRGPSRKTGFVWDGDVVLHEVNSRDEHDASVVDWEFYPDGFAPTAKVSNGKQYLCVNDIAGTPRELTAQDGEVAWTSYLTTFGKVKASSVTTVGCPVRFQGQWHDDEIGLHYNRFRYYLPGTGRFLSKDPIGLEGGTNLYLYVLNPINWIDPLGLTTWDCKAKRWRKAGKFTRRPSNPSQLVNNGRISHADIIEWANQQGRSGLPDLWSPSAAFPTGGFKYSKSTKRYIYTIWGHGINPHAVTNYPGSNAATGPTASITRAPLPVGSPGKVNNMTTGAWAPFSADPNAAHIPLDSSPF